MHNQGKSCLKRFEKIIKSLQEVPTTDVEKRAAAVLLALYAEEYATIFKIMKPDEATYIILGSKMNDNDQNQ